MSYGFLDLAMTPGVRKAQAAMVSSHLWTDFGIDRSCDQFTEVEMAFIAARDNFYIATVSETGRPYIQHRGGPTGFLRSIDERTLAFADYSGNRQYISVGNISANDRVCLFLMDYAGRHRLKVYARAQTLALDAEPELTKRLLGSEVRGRPERLILLSLEAFDWNCPQHIVRRFTEAEIDVATRPLRERLATLEAENAALRQRLAT